MKKVKILIPLVIVSVGLAFLFGWLFSNNQLTAPTLKINTEALTIQWQNVSNAEYYSIYLNDELIVYQDAATSSGQSDVYNTYKFEESDDNVIYTFYVIAHAEGYTESEQSNEVSYKKNTDQQIGVTISGMTISNSKLNVVENFRWQSTNLIWDSIGAELYYVTLNISGVTDLICLSTEYNSIDISSYINTYNGKIISIRVGVKNDDNQLELSEQCYYNPNAIGGSDYAEKYYHFLGEVNDYYIQSQYELNHIYFYMFTSKQTELKIVCNLTTFNSSTKMSACLSSASSSFNETTSYQPSFTYTQNSGLAYVTIYIDYFARSWENEVNAFVEEFNTMEQSAIERATGTPYYEQVIGKTNYVARLDSYDSFPADNNTKYQYVNNSDELYLALQSGVTPLFESDQSAAYKVYQQAKVVLRKIITDNMSDDEKVKCIFDYICYNSTYDYNIVGYNEEDDPFTTYSSFYIEGVLFDRLAVCDGFSKTFSLLCNMEGINAVRISGTANSSGLTGNSNYDGGHAWNKVLIAGNWYVVDITWCQPSQILLGVKVETLNSNYYLLSDEDIEKTHSATTSVFYYNPEALNNYSDTLISSVLNLLGNNQIYDFKDEPIDMIEIYSGSQSGFYQNKIC